MHHLKITKYFLLFFFFAALLLRVSSPLYAQTTVTTVVPAKHALNIATATTIQVTLNAAMSTTSLNDTSSFIVSGATSGRHRGSFAFSNGNTIATFNPTIDFLRGEVVTVNVTSNVKDGSNNSVTPFITQFTIASNRSTGSFASRADYGTGSNPQTIFMSDIDDDGDADFATANYWGGNVTVWKNSGDGTFASRNDISTSANPWGISMNDVDNDGDGDIIVSHNSSSLVSVLNNNGNGTFAAKEDYSVPAGRGIYVSDLNGDGYVDIAVANSDNVTVLMNNGNGTFASGVNYSGGGTTISVFIKDVDNDGDGDIVTTNFTASSISVLKNNGNGTFASKVDYTTEAQPWSVFVSDVDGDGDADIAVTYIGTSAVSVLKNNGDGTFATKVNYTTGTDPKSVFISDVDGDGDGDIVVGNKTDNNVSVLKNNGNGTFAGKTDFPLAANANPESVFLTDVDGNGTPDIATANWNGPSVSILRNIEITKVAAISPEQNALNVSPSSNIQVTFNKSMNSSSITDSTLIVSGNVSGKHNGSITFINGNSVATFNPTNDFKRGEVVTVNVTTDVKDNTNTDVQTFTSQFTVEVNPSPGTFSTRTTYTTGGGPEYPYAVDIDNDGDVDVLTANYSGSSISVLKNNGSGTFGTRVDYPVGGSPYVVIAGDLDDDGDADIVSSGTNVDSVYVLKNNGNGIFASAMGYQTNGYPEGGHFMQDIDGDGDNDIVAGGGLSSFSVLLNNGDGTFAPFLSSLTASNPYYVTGGDMNGDGYLDVIAVCPSGSKVSIALNNGNGTFADRVDYQTGNNPYFVAVQDVDGDGDLDVIASLYSDGNISIYQNNGDGSLGARVDYSSGISPTAVFLSDVEGDGDADIVVSNDVSDAAQNVLNPRIRESQTKVQLKKTTGSIAILKNNGNGTFETKIDYDGGSSAWGISLTDIDGDGDGDMIVPNYYDNTISVLRNVLSPPQNVFARGGNETAVVKWDANSENGFKQYNIYTGTTPNPTSFVGNTTPGNINETSIVVSGLTNGTINYFRVTAVDSAGGESNYSEQDAAVPVVEGGDAISLNGISDYVTANVSLSSYSQFTVEAYVKINGPLNGFITIVEFGDDSPFFGINNGTPVFYPAVWATTTINQNQWYHLAWVYDGTNAYIYIDGILYGFAANPEFSKSGTEMGIGYHNGDGHFNGSIDEVRIWNVARYQSEIRASLGSPAQGDESGLVALYHFDEGTGFTAIDGSVNANDGTLIGEPSYVVSQAMIPFIPKGFGVNSQANQIYLHWYANTEGDIQSYKIYKGTQSPADSLAFTVSSAAEDFYDTDVPSLMPYYYRITAVDNVGNESDFSNEVSTTPLFYSSVSGMVWNDENSNSEKDAGELGVSGWTIRLEEQVGKRKDENKTSVTDVTTDADGNYSFTQVLPGFYKIAQINLSTWIQTFPLDSGDYFLEVVNGENYSGKSFGIVRRGIVIPPANDSIFYWNDTSVWSGGRIPTAEDSIVIPPNITIILNTDSLLAQNKSVGTLIISTGSIIQALGNDTLRIIGNLMINGTLNVDSVTNPVFNCEGNFIVNGVFRPGRSHIIIIGTTQQKVGSGGGPGKYTASTTTEFYTITNTNSLMETQGKIVVNNALVVDAPFTMSESNGGIPDTIVIENDDPTSVRGSGTIRNGAMRRRIKGQTGKTAVAYQFHSSNTSIEIDTIGNNPEYVTIAKFPTLSADTSRYFA
ncbi:MAG: VCBS repeat-containing protein, partial [Ignavibacteriales bacterium]|nr:VCBS repeat-containing protein [Ignavibacteriales bacterium]